MSEVPPDAVSLRTCPFCGTVPAVETSAHWTGMRSVPVGFRLMHHCKPEVAKGRMFVDFGAPTLGMLADYWNRRAP